MHQWASCSVSPSAKAARASAVEKLIDGSLARRFGRVKRIQGLERLIAHPALPIVSSVDTTICQIC